MFAVIFEVQPKRERWDEYLGIAKGLKPKLEAIEGFIDNERFRSKRTEGRLLSLSIWRDEKAVIRWRTQAEHHGAQERGRFEVFEDYHLRVGEVTEDSAPPQGVSLDQQRFDETAVGAAKVVTVTIAPPGETLPALEAGREGVIDSEVYESITTEGKRLLLVSWRDAAAAAGFRPSAGQHHRAVRIIRDYGISDRREAPQFYPELRKHG
jgi:heme-degrading monooxygenase HmoA